MRSRVKFGLSYRCYTKGINYSSPISSKFKNMTGNSKLNIKAMSIHCRMYSFYTTTQWVTSLLTQQFMCKYLPVDAITIDFSEEEQFMESELCN